MRSLFLISFLAILSFNLRADSPLTSTNFYTVYEEYDIVHDALDAKGKITNEIMLYLSDRSYPIDIKVAAINALGWNFNGQDNFKTYLDFIEMRLGITQDQESFFKKIDADELLCLAYLKAMDNYFDVKEAKQLAELAILKSRRAQFSYTFQLINGLIGAQIAMDDSWCKVYQLTQKVKENNSLNYDFPEEAEDVVFEYMDLYHKECN